MTRRENSRHLRAVWREVDWYPEMREWVERLNGVVPQAVVTVNPWEFDGIAVACGLVPLVDAIVTSGELRTRSRVAMAHRAHELLGLPTGVSTTLLIDNRPDNVDEFVHADGRALRFVRERFATVADVALAPLVA